MAGGKVINSLALVARKFFVIYRIADLVGFSRKRLRLCQAMDSSQPSASLHKITSTFLGLYHRRSSLGDESPSRLEGRSHRSQATPRRPESTGRATAL
jgi:hypothetical protein